MRGLMKEAWVPDSQDYSLGGYVFCPNGFLVLKVLGFGLNKSPCFTILRYIRKFLGLWHLACLCKLFEKVQTCLWIKNNISRNIHKLRYFLNKKNMPTIEEKTREKIINRKMNKTFRKMSFYMKWFPNTENWKN